jgi:5,6-dimethylbenzimidazole synthase
VNDKENRPAPVFDPAFRARLKELIAWRRDVRRFRDTPVAPDLLDHLLDVACLAPSVGNSQPWRFVLVEDAGRRRAVRDNFAACNARAGQLYADERAKQYAALKLAGFEAPVHLAVFCDETTGHGHGLGKQTMPETLRYSVVGAIHTLWLAARAHGLGMGWVSVLDPAVVCAVLETPQAWSFIAYLCLGYPSQEHDVPELVRLGWQDRTADCRRVLKR